MKKDRFGFTAVLFKEEQLYKQNFNLYVSFFYSTLGTKQLKETDLFILDKSKSYESNLDCLKIRHVFPNYLLSIYVYTDNKKKIPLEYQVVPKEKQKQLSLFD